MHFKSLHFHSFVVNLCCIAHHINTLKQWTWKITSTGRPVIAIKTCTSTSRSRLKSYKRLVSVSSRNFNVSSRSRLGWWRQHLGLVSVSGGERLGLVSVSSFYVSCPSLSLAPQICQLWCAALTALALSCDTGNSLTTKLVEIEHTRAIQLKQILWSNITFMFKPLWL